MASVNIIHFLLNIHEYIRMFIQDYGNFTYGILFFIIFLETGFVVTPFLPGDTLLFATGTFASQGDLNVMLLFVLLSAAAIIGDSVNYWIGNYFGEKILRRMKFVKREYLEKTKNFYKKYGGRTIIYARFIPIIRTFAPFIAGVGRMEYGKFLTFNVVGAIVWVLLFLLAGYYFGKIQFVRDNLTIIIYLIIFVSILPPITEWMKHKMKNRHK